MYGEKNEDNHTLGILTWRLPRLDKAGHICGLEKKVIWEEKPTQDPENKGFPCQSTGHICHEPAFANQVGKATEDTHIITHSETCLRTELLLKADISRVGVQPL